MKSTFAFTAASMTLACVAACQQPAPAPNRYEIHFRAEDDRGAPLSKLSIQVGETLLGETDVEGLLHVEVNAREGERYGLQAPCPSDHLPQEGPSEVFFRSIKGLKGEMQNRIDLEIVCARVRRVAALLVHADGYQDMPVFIDGVAQGHTGAEGFAHLRLDLPPGAQFQVSLDSSEHPTLVPANPSQTMTIGEDDGLFVFDPVFREAQVEKKAPRRRSRPKGPPPVVEPKRPVRID